MLDLNILLPTNYTNLGVVFLIGLVAGISTCGGLISSFVLGISAKNEEFNPNKSFKKKIYPHLIFNFGRIFFFAFFGFIAGIFGQFLSINNTILGLLIFLSSVILLFVGFKILNIETFLSKCGINLNFIDKFLLKYKPFIDNKLGSTYGLFLIGGLTFLLPCGFTQSIQVFAITQANPLLSALTLFVFVLGTTPGLLALASASSFFSSKKSSWYFKLIGVIVIYFSIVNILNSFSLFGINLFISEKNLGQFKIINGYQELRINQTHQGYFPNILTVKKGIPVKLIVNSKNNTTCASYLVIEKFGIREFLELGENTFEFTPNETGEFQFSCGMGMHPGIIKVID